MSRSLYTSICIFSCFIHTHCRHWMLSNMWFLKCVMLLHRGLSRRIPRLCWTHEGMGYRVEPIHVVRLTLPKRYTYLTNRCSVFRKLNPSIINVFYTEKSSSKVWRNGLDIPKLSYNPLWCMTINRPHLICPKNKEITSNSLEAR